jgi:hypothetical protein
VRYTAVPVIPPVTGDEGWDGDEHGAFFLLHQKGVAVVDLLEEDKLASERLW